MPHIKLPDGMPGIVGAFAFRPETAKPLRDLAEVLLRGPFDTLRAGPNELTSAEREMIAAFVSSRNECRFCELSHSAAAAHHPTGSRALVDAVKRDFETADISPKLKGLLAIAAKIQRGGKYVTAADIERARNHGATDVEIHDAVLIAAAFCMFNRYVDGLAAWTPEAPGNYEDMGRRMATDGYLRPSRT